MKVSKPVLIALVLAIVFSLYLVFFTGKKKPLPQIPLPQEASQAIVAGAMLEAPKSDEVRTQLSKLNTAWDRDPFILPKDSIEKRVEQPKTMLKLVAILESKNGRVAIFGNDIVSKGDVIDGERVQEIGKDRVILIRNGSKRIVSIPESALEVLQND